MAAASTFCCEFSGEKARGIVEFGCALYSYLWPRHNFKNAEFLEKWENLSAVKSPRFNEEIGKGVLVLQFGVRDILKNIFRNKRAELTDNSKNSYIKMVEEICQQRFDSMEFYKRIDAYELFFELCAVIGEFFVFADCRDINEVEIDDAPAVLGSIYSMYTNRFQKNVWNKLTHEATVRYGDMFNGLLPKLKSMKASYATLVFKGEMNDFADRLYKEYASIFKLGHIFGVPAMEMYVFGLPQGMSTLSMTGGPRIKEKRKKMVERERLEGDSRRQFWIKIKAEVKKKTEPSMTEEQSESTSSTAAASSTAASTSFIKKLTKRLTRQNVHDPGRRSSEILASGSRTGHHMALRSVKSADYGSIVPPIVKEAQKEVTRSKSWSDSAAENAEASSSVPALIAFAKKFVKSRASSTTKVGHSSFSESIEEAAEPMDGEAEKIEAENKKIDVPGTEKDILPSSARPLMVRRVTRSSPLAVKSEPTSQGSPSPSFQVGEEKDDSPPNPRRSPKEAVGKIKSPKRFIHDSPSKRHDVNCDEIEDEKPHDSPHSFTRKRSFKKVNFKKK